MAGVQYIDSDELLIATAMRARIGLGGEIAESQIQHAIASTVSYGSLSSGPRVHNHW